MWVKNDTAFRIDRENVFIGHIFSENEIPHNEDNERNWNIPDLMVTPLRYLSVHFITVISLSVPWISMICYSFDDSRIYFISMLVKPFSHLIFNLTYEHPITRELGEYSIPIYLFLDKVSFLISWKTYCR